MDNSLSRVDLMGIIKQRLYGAEYQPLVCLKTAEIYAWEALARFYTDSGLSISPAIVFEALHDSPLTLAQVELDLKQLQLEGRPQGYPLFLNLDPDAYLGFAIEGQTNPLVDLICRSDQVVVELIENTSVSDANACNQLSQVFHQQDIELALDDVGAPGSMLSLQVLEAVDFIKFDRSWLGCREDSAKFAMLQSLIGFAAGSGKRTVLEGVETEADLRWAQRLGVDLVQGFLYRDQFRRFSNNRE
ncbi:EAL domain-containing protein [Marinobacterium jannaschii]|uniref:EAL domain-containing protein n=1 Tax=Marinobacterium jannaschii TaxID=64970 RepID=UPI0004892DAD|nr:EAL domain-containing protein [Marinobacterium jannaschii]